MAVGEGCWQSCLCSAALYAAAQGARTIGISAEQLQAASQHWGLQLVHGTVNTAAMRLKTHCVYHITTKHTYSKQDPQHKNAAIQH